MPLFDFRCRDCSARFTKLIGMTADSSEPVCPKCGSKDAKKLISRFARLRSENEALDALEESSLHMDPDSPGDVRRMLKEMGGHLGEDMDEDVDEMLDEAEQDFFVDEEP